MDKLTLEQFYKKLKEKHKQVYSKRWSNYPRSIFFYDIPDFDGATDTIGIYTNESLYGFGSC